MPSKSAIRERLILGALVTAFVCAWLPGVASAATAEKVTVKLSSASVVADGSSTLTVTAVVTVAGVRVIGHAVQFSANDPGIQFSATTEKPNGAYTAILTSSTTAGTVIVSAVDTSVTPPATGQVALSQTAGQATAMTLGLAPASIAADGNSYTTATATLADAHGNPVTGDTVGFSSSDPGQQVVQVTNGGNGTYSALIKGSTTPGQSTITATDSSAGLQAVAVLTQTLSGSRLSLTAFPSSVVTNQSVTLLAAVTASSSPSGTITFTSGGTPIAGCVGERVTPSTPAATCTTTFSASMSPASLTAAFTADAGSGLGSSSNSTTVLVSPDATATSLDASQTTGVGSMTTYTATVTEPTQRAGTVQPTGSVEFLDGGQPIASCLSQPLSSGGAVCTVAYGAIGTHSITARYAGDTNFNGSTSSPKSVSVAQLPVGATGIITSTLQWTFRYAKAYTTLLTFVANGVPTGASVRINCTGGGCPFSQRVQTLAKTKRCQPVGKGQCAAPGQMNLAPPFQKHRLRVGTRISVRITRRGWVGKSYSFTIRSGRGPRVQIGCLAPGATRPGVGC
jgi:Big-like domain-containing protein/invasin-like protein